MTPTQIFDEIRRWPPQDKWFLVESLLRDLRMSGGNPTLDGVQQPEVRQVMTLLGTISVLPAAAVMDAAGLFDLEGDALRDTKALYE